MDDRPLATVCVASVPHGLAATIVGEIDLSNVHHIEQELTRAAHELSASGGSTLLVRLAQTSYIDSAGLRMLEAVWRLCSESSSELRLVAPTGSFADHVLTISGFNRLFSVTTNDPFEVSGVADGAP